jgi:hypothetical protein
LIFDINSALAEISIDDIEFEPEPEPIVADDPIEEPEMNEEEPMEEPMEEPIEEPEVNEEEVVEEPTE